MASFFVAHLRLAVLVLVIFALGVGMGAWAVGALDVTQRTELLTYLWELERVMDARSGAAAGPELLRVAVSQNLRTLAAIWVGGLLVIGVPVAPFLVMVRGFVIGFTTGFLASEAGWRGVLFSLGAVLPHNLVAVPALWAAAVAALSFAGKAWTARRRRWAGAFAGDVVAYVGTGIVIASLLGLASLVEAYVTPALIRLLGGLVRG
ncbi:MAG: stage II sporulation protein M [Firmicutes bacterium]|nr:stage II sporulation protein M [Bacillota bacterium]